MSLKSLRSYSGGWDRKVANELALLAEMAYEVKGDTKSFTFIEDEGTGTQAFLLYEASDPDSPVAVLSFRGTEPSQVLDIMSDLDCRKVRYAGGHVHNGFYEAYSSVQGQITDLVQALPGDCPLYVTGHSLGGALATIAAYDIDANIRRVQAVMTFGSPRVFDNRMANIFAIALSGRYYRIFNRSDVVARVPTIFRWKHVGIPVFIDHKGVLWIRPSLLTRMQCFYKNVLTGKATSVGRDHSMSNYIMATG